ncbi:MAG: SDR family NAD(P)-dependent oxidoreductase [Myxococcaceae bacterium]|nr:SDR family NAD(P)-dependent oxidoreductase [Myxococcaceae bacterium]
MTFTTALITGASSGLGRGLALHFAKAGTHVYAAARRKDELEVLAQEAKAAGGALTPVVLDVSDADQAFEVLQRLDGTSGGFDLLVANAGVGDDSNGRKLDWKKVKRVLDVNVLGAAATVSAVLPGMVARGKGHVVGISSLAAFRGLPRSGAYSGSKAFLHTFLESLRVDLAGTPVTVGAIYPGFVKSELTAKNKHPMPFLLETDDAVRRMAKAIEAREKTFAFPWQMSLGVRTLSALPLPLYGLAAKRLR